MKKPLGLLLLAATVIGGAFWLLPRKSPQLVLLISLDTMGANHMSVYGYERQTTPELERFVQEDAIAFDCAMANSMWTLPSTMSLMTGLYVENHGLDARTEKTSQLSADVFTVAQHFLANGYRTAGWSDGGFTQGSYGFDRGFEQFQSPAHAPVGFEGHSQEVMDWITENREFDSFVFFQTYDAHAPFDTPLEFRTKFDEAPDAWESPKRSLLASSLSNKMSNYGFEQYADISDVVDDYDGGISYVDHELAKLFDHIKSLDLWDECVILVTSDHGESFLSESIYVGHGLFRGQAEIRVPMLLKLPHSDRAGLREKRAVQGVDAMPTLLSAAGLDVPPDLDGMPLDRLAGREHWPREYTFGFSDSFGFNYLAKGDTLYTTEASTPWGAFQLGWNPRALRRKRNLWLYGDPFDLGRTEYFQPSMQDAFTGQFIPMDPTLQAEFEAAAEDFRDIVSEKRRPPASREGDSEAHLASLAALGYVTGDETSTEATMPKYFEATVAAGDVDWALFFDIDERLWHLRRMGFGQVPMWHREQLDQEARSLAESLETITRDHPHQSQHVEWRVELLERAHAYLVTTGEQAEGQAGH